jgi:hypothetical protein
VGLAAVVDGVALLGLGALVDDRGAAASGDPFGLHAAAAAAAAAAAVPRSRARRVSGICSPYGGQGKRLASASRAQLEK